MGGGISRLESTDWQAADGTLDNDSIQQTIDGRLPSSKFGLYEIQKKTVGQREFDLINEQLELMYTTKAVTGTVSWFDVLGPGSCGDYVDSKLRVTSDIARRTWIVYRYHLPVFEGQKPCSDPAVIKGLQDGVLLYRTACITVSWSRYIAVAARYGPPNLSDFLDVAVERSPSSLDISSSASNSERQIKSVGSHDDHDDNAIQSPHELHQQQQQQGNALQKPEQSGDAKEQEEDINNYAADCEVVVADDEIGGDTSGGVEEMKEEEADARSNIGHSDTNDGDRGGSEPKQSASDVSGNDQSKAQLIESGSTVSEGTDVGRSSSAPPSAPEASAATINNMVSTNGRSSRMLPATTLTTSVKAAAAAAAAKSGSSTLSSSMIAGGGSNRRRLRDYFKGGSSQKTSQSQDPRSPPEDGDPEPDEGDEAERLKQEAMKLNLLYELALEGVIDLDTQPIIECQEVYNKMIGNHQTFLMSKDQAIKLLQMDEKQHEEQLEQQHANGEAPKEDDNGAAGFNPMIQAVELDAKHKEDGVPQQSPTNSSSPQSRWMSRWSSVRAPPTNSATSEIGGGTSIGDAASKSDEGVTKNDGTQKSSAQNEPEHPWSGFGSGRRIRSSWNRLVSSSAKNDPVVIPEGEREESSQLFQAAKESTDATQSPTTLNNVTMPSLLDESASSSNLDETSTATTAVTDEDGAESVAHTVTITDAVAVETYPGSGVEESKDSDDISDTRNPGSTSVCSTDTVNDDENVSAAKPTPQPKEERGEVSDETTQARLASQQPEDKDEPPPPPLVGYFSWKHTTMNFAQHKMVLHLAKNSDLALHLVLSIIVNQVRSERNHTVFLTTGLHPTWLYPTSWKNPKEMIS